MADSITKDEMAKLLDRQAQTLATLIKGGSVASSTTASVSDFTGELGKAGGEIRTLTTGFGMLGSAGTKLYESFKEIYDATNANIGMLQGLSKSGMNFSGDVVGMTASVKGMRLSNQEFAEIMTKNAAGFTALGGNATRGAEAFAKLAADFQRSEFADSLIAAGFTNKELNEVLALQVTIGKAAIKTDDESRRKAIIAANELAKEMDLTAKLTGKSREEQMSAQQKLKDDMALEAKLRQQTAGMEAGEAAEYRKKVMQQMAEAELAGQGQVLKEKFIYGQIISDLAVQQEITAGRESMDAREKQAQLLRNKELASADEQGKIARTALISFQKSAEGLELALLPGNEALSKSSHDLMKQTLAQADAIQAIRQEEAFKNKTDREIEAEANRRSKEAFAGRDKEGNQVNQTTEAMVKLNQRSRDVESAFFNNLVVPANRDMGPSIKKLSDRFLTGTIRQPGQEGPGTAFETIVGGVMQRNYEASKLPQQGGVETDRANALRDLEARRSLHHLGTAADVVAKALAAAGTAAAKFTDLVNSGAQTVQQVLTPTKRRETGSIGMTGKLFEDFGQGTLVELHGKESVLTEKQFIDLASGMKQVNISEIVGKLNTSISKFNPTPKEVVSSREEVKSPLSTQTLDAALTKYQQVMESIKKSEMEKTPKTNISSNSQNFSTGMQDIFNRLNYSVSSKTGGADTIGLQTPTQMNNFKGLSVEEMSKTMIEANRALWIQMQTGKNEESKTKSKEITTAATDKPSPTPTQIKDKKATLDDVVTALNQLNIKLSHLVETNIDIGSKQIKAVQSGNRNIFERV